MKKAYSGVAALAALAVAGMAAPGLAQEEKAAEKKVERIIIMEHGDHGEGDMPRVKRMRIEGGPGETHVVRLRGKGDHRVKIVDCDGDKTEIDEGDDKMRTRIVLCGDEKLSAEERAAKLESIRDKLGERERMSDEHRARVETALTEAINRLRATD